ncbi:MAG: sigma-70 family RNA polymerase sigma factor [Bacteroidetes bacterium]|nr:sigma-70 family RNA polymerase sigma factor [Bacteroidota bacterium]
MAQTAAAISSDFSLPDAEQDLIRACIDGERRAQKTLYLQYSRAMYTLAYRITGDEDMAHDALQEAFLEIFRDLKTFRASSTLGAWMKTIVVRKSVKKFRFEQQFETIDDNSEEYAIPYQEFASSALEREIQNLPEGCRTVFTLFEIEGYKHKEIAEMLNITPSTSRTQLLHAKKILRKKLSNENQ